jgi:hypothetical protein
MTEPDSECSVWRRLAGPPGEEPVRLNDGSVFRYLGPDGYRKTSLLSSSPYPWTWSSPVARRAGSARYVAGTSLYGERGAVR